MNHYFQNNPKLQSKERVIAFEVFGKKFELLTDDGIFSKNHFDEGTNTLLQVAIQQPLFGRCLDLGCANGIVGIVLKSFFPSLSFDLVDINQRAVALAQKNVHRFGWKDVSVFYSDGFDQITHQYQQIFFNPPIRAGKAVVYRLYEQAHAHLDKQGSLYVVIRKSLGAKSSQDKLMQLFDNCVIIKRNKGFYVLHSIKS